MKDLLDVAIAVSASYLFVGSVLWMLLIDELRFECATEREPGAKRTALFLLMSMAVILLWPVTLFRLARKAVGR